MIYVFLPLAFPAWLFYATGDTIDAVGVGTNATATLGAGNLLTVTGSGGTVTMHLDPSQSFAGEVFSTAADAGGTGVNIALAAAPPTSGTLFSANFDAYTGAGLSPGATGAYQGSVAGTLNSNIFKAVGFSDAQPGYGGTVGTGDYGRGLLANTDDPFTAGLYSGVTGNSGTGDHAVLIQPTAAEFDVNGYVELKIENTTGQTVTSLSTAFDWVYHNNEPRGDNLQLAYSTDGVNFTVLPTANLTTPTTASTTSPVPFTYVHESVTLPDGTVVAPGSDLYLRFEHPSSTGSGNRDEVGFDNVNVAYGAVSNVPVLSINSVSANEGNSGTTPFTFTVTRAGDLSSATTVHYATADGTATAGSDYTAVSGDLTFAAGVSSENVTVLVNGDTVQEPDETFSVVLSNPTNATLQNTSGLGTILNDDTSITSIGDVQGAATTSPFAGQTVTTEGVVTAVKAGSGGGFYIQDPTDAGPAGASHGLFVYTAATPTVMVGDQVTVQGLVSEYAAQANDRPTTELNNPTITVTSHNNAVTPVIIGPDGVLPPTSTIAGPTYDPVHNGVDFYESLEGQLVTVENAQATDSTYSGSTWVVADLGREATGINARGGITASAGDFDPERIQVYSSALNATMGEHLGNITGVISYYNGEYELIPTAAITPPGNSATSPPTLPLETTTLKGDATHLSLAAYNVENLGPSEPGVPQATVDARFAALGQDIAHNLGSPDVIGLEEIQDADGEGTGSDLSGAATLNKLIAAIAAAGGPTYQYVEIDPTTANSTGGAPNGNIRSAYLYNPARVSYVAGSATLINDNDPTNGDAFTNSRHPLAAQFMFNGQVVNAIDVHDYARSGSEELFGLDQPAMNSGDQRRIDQTAAVNAYVNQLLAANPNANITVQGDFNGFPFETTLTQLAHGGGGQLNELSNLLPVNERYSTTFEGISEEIDNELVSDSLDQNAQFDIVHLNTGQVAANQASDHDPIVSLLAVGNSLTVASGSVQTLSTVQTYTGKTLISGELDLASGGSIASSSQVALKASGAVFDVSGAGAGGATVTIQELSGVAGSTIKLGAGVLSLTESVAAAYSGAITGTGGLVVNGTAPLTLSGTDGYTGKTQIFGQLDLAGSAVLNQSKAVTLRASGAVFDISGATVKEAILNLAGVSGSHIYLGANSLKVNESTTATFSGVISDGGTSNGVGGSLIVKGTASLDLTGANTFTGGVTLQSGTLELGSTTAAGAGGRALTFAGAATLQLDAGALSGSGTAHSYGTSIAGLAANDHIDLSSLAYVSGAQASYGGGMLTVTSGGSTVALTLTSVPAGDTFTVGNDGQGHVLVGLVGAG